jgi:hypothetical protein
MATCARCGSSGLADDEVSLTDEGWLCDAVCFKSWDAAQRDKQPRPVGLFTGGSRTARYFRIGFLILFIALCTMKLWWRLVRWDYWRSDVERQRSTETE